jgi:hypothetical protein
MRDARARALAPQRMHWTSAFLQTCMQQVNPMLHWPRPWIEAVNLCTRLSSRRSLGSPWLARHPTHNLYSDGCKSFKRSDSPSPMCGSSRIRPWVRIWSPSRHIFGGLWIQSWPGLGGSVFWWEPVGSGSSQLLRESTRFSFQNYFRFILINQGIGFS